MNERLPITDRISAIRMVRNNPYHCYVTNYLDLLARKETPVKVRVAMAEALGWFVHSRERIHILENVRTFCKRLTCPMNFRLKYNKQYID